MLEYNIKIWKPTFLENRLGNPLIYKTFDQVLIPYFGKTLGAYYGLTRGEKSEQLKQAVWQLNMPQTTTRKSPRFKPPPLSMFNLPLIFAQKNHAQVKLGFERVAIEERKVAL